MKYAFCIFAAVLIPATAVSQVYQVRLPNGGASATCIGLNPPCFITAKHVVRGARSVEVSDGSNWYRALRIATDATDDLATFETVGGTFERTGLVEDVPEGVDVTACGWTPDRKAFCWTAGVYGDWLYARNNSHSLPGDSGGGAFVQTANGKCLVGMHVGYDCTSRPGNRCETLIVPSRKICRFLKTQYGSCPTCPQFIPPQPIQRPRIVQPVTPRPQPRPDVIAGGCNVVVDYDRVAREVFERYGDRLKGRDGANGTNGGTGPRGEPGDTPTLDLDELANVITSKYADRIRGERGTNGNDGTPGEQGPRGMIGVPDNDDIRNWLVGASSDPNTRAMLATVFADIVAADPRVETLIERLDALERRESTRDDSAVAPIDGGQLAAITARVKLLETPRRVLIVDGSTNAVLDDETYGPGEPMVLDVRRLIQKGKAP